MNEVLKCAEINNLHFPLERVNIEIWVLKATVRKLLMNSIVYFYNWCHLDTVFT